MAAPSVPSKADASGLKSMLELVAECDDFPYAPGTAHSAATDEYYLFALLERWAPECVELKTHGYILPSVVVTMPWLPAFQVDHQARIVWMPYSPGQSESEMIAAQLQLARNKGSFRILDGWRDELYLVHGVRGRRVEMERAGSALFGIETRGVHCIAYVWLPSSSAPGRELKLYVPRRAATKSTYPSLLDNTVAGGMASTETPWVALLREASEEASLSPSVVARARAVGTVSYMHLRDARAGGEMGLLQPEIQWCYDLELRHDRAEERPQVNDNEVASFELMGVEEAWTCLRRGDFKPNCGLVLIDFFVRWGFLRPGADRPSDEAKARAHMEQIAGERAAQLADRLDEDGRRAPGWLIPSEEYGELVSRLHRRCIYEDAQARLMRASVTRN